MYAIIENGGKQYQVKEGDTLKIELLSAKKEVTFDKVLLVADNEKVEVGSPYIGKAKVKAKVLENGKGDKVTVFKYRNKVNYRRKRGHRQPFSKIQIEEIKLGGA